MLLKRKKKTNYCSKRTAVCLIKIPLETKWKDENSYKGESLTKTAMIPAWVIRLCYASMV
jgi:hypothetical protein